MAACCGARMHVSGVRSGIKALLRTKSEANPALAILLQQIESDQEIKTMLEQHERWRENRIGDRPASGRLDLEGISPNAGDGKTLTSIDPALIFR
jgi:hypothetical protein